jgi:diguanylate cyclase
MYRPSTPSAQLPRPPATRLSNRELLPRRVYRFRMLGMGLAGLPLLFVLNEHNAPPAAYAWAIFTCVLWPQLARWLAGRGPHAYKRELRNLMLDSIIAGSWIPLLHFSVLPSALLATVATADKINTGVRNLWWRSLPGMALAILFCGWITDFAFEPETSMAVIFACLPIMVLHTLGVSLASYRLIRKVQHQNYQLDALSRIDALTGLDNRHHWQEWARTLLQQHHAEGRPATMLMVDVDSFKHINDQHGHILGDDVLCAIAAILRKGCGPNAHIGRFGGDEFAVALAGTRADAAPVAEYIRHAAEKLVLPGAPGLRCSVSIGVAEAGDSDDTLREWMESADRAMYGAKHGGRNCTVNARDVRVGAPVTQANVDTHRLEQS